MTIKKSKAKQVETKPAFKKAGNLTIENELIPGFLIFCHDAIEAKDGSLSLVRLIDRVTSNGLPAKLNNLTIVGEFLSSGENSRDFDFELRIISPQKKALEVGPFKVSTNPDLQANRLVLKCQNFCFASAGVYKFELDALDGKTKQKYSISRNLEVRTTGKLEVADATVI